MTTHSHKIITVIKERPDPSKRHWLYQLEMDCPVQPIKVVVVSRRLQVGEEFDPHFANEQVVARFSPDGDGWYNGLLFLSVATMRGDL